MKTIFASAAAAHHWPRNKSWFAQWLLAIAFVGIGWFGGQSASAQNIAAFNPADILVKPLSGVDLSAVNHAFGLKVLRAFPAIGNLAIVQVPPGVTADDLIAFYRHSGLVEYAERDYYVRALATPNDPDYSAGDQWSLYNYGQNGGLPGADIHAWEAWNYITSAAKVVVAVVDTGVAYTHPDLAGNMWVNPKDGSHGINVVKNGRAANDPWDDYGHGSHVAGIIGAVTDNGVGLAGICWHTQIMACKFLDSGGQGTISGAITCLNYAREHGAKVVNASWGSFTFTSQSLYDAIRSLRNADIIFVAAAGNSDMNNDVMPLYPASYSATLNNVVAVAATDDHDLLASFSNYGATNVDLAAPGVNILSCWNGSNSDYYAYDLGTSMACAEVTGACTLLRAAFPGENQQQIIQRILNNTDSEPALQGKCKAGGRLNLYQALEISSSPSSPSPLPIGIGPLGTGLGL
jgi:subtilisin family serine protease